MSTLRELESLYNKLLDKRDAILDVLEDKRASDYEYNIASKDIKIVEAELSDIEYAIEAETKLSDRHRNDYSRQRNNSRNDSFARSSFNRSGGRGGNTGLPVDDLGTFRSKNSGNVDIYDRPEQSSRMSSNAPSFRTKVATPINVNYSLTSWYPYIIDEGITVKDEIRGSFKERELYGTAVDAKDISITDITESMSDSSNIINYISTGDNVKYYTDYRKVFTMPTSLEAKISDNLNDILKSGENLEDKYTIPTKVNPYINSYVCSVLNDALILNNNSAIIADMYDFRDLLKRFSDVKTVILKEITDSISNVQINVRDKVLKLELYTVTICGFKMLEEAMLKVPKDENSTSEHEAMFVTANSHPAIYKTLVSISDESESDVLSIITSTGMRLRVVIARTNNKAIIRKDNQAY